METSDFELTPKMLLPWDDPEADILGLMKWIGIHCRVPTEDDLP